MIVDERASLRFSSQGDDPYVTLADSAVLQECAAERTAFRHVIDQLASEVCWDQVLEHLAGVGLLQLTLVTGRVVTGIVVELGRNYVTVGETRGCVVVQADKIAVATSGLEPSCGATSDISPSVLARRDRELIEVVDRHCAGDERITVELLSGRSITGSVGSTGQDVVEIRAGRTACTWIPVTQIVAVSRSAVLPLVTP